jgi:2,4-dienoyl-CoA reductase-like NADH-dependent reductase (Old Yellow Enzyme family)
LVFAPINTGFAQIDGKPTARLRRFHEARSGDAIGVSMLGNVAIERAFETNSHTAVLADRADVARFAAIARAIQRRGSLPGIQLSAAPSDLSPWRGWRASDLGAEVARLRSLTSAYRPAEIESLLDAFVRSAELARDAGYSVIQIHAAHGYSLSLLLHPAINRRRDSFAVSGEWFPNFVGRVREVTRAALLSIRLSCTTGITDRDTELDTCRLASSQAIGAGADLIDLSAGAYTVDRRLIYPNRGDEPLSSRPFARELLSGFQCLVAVAGNVLGPEDLPSDLEDRLVVNVGRALIADPDFALKLRESRGAEINRCRRTGHCHYFSRGQDSISCGSNPEV